MKIFLPIVLLLLLILVACFQVFGEARQRAHMAPPDVGDLLPKKIQGWTVTDRPIADSPDMQKVVDSVLNYDSAVFRIYKKEDVEISVYLAYWLPGKIDPALIDAHTPDICWVDNGWQDTKLSPLPAQVIDGVQLPIPNYRKFTADGHTLFVAFWQIDGRSVRHGTSIAEAKAPVMQLVSRRIDRVITGITTRPGQQLFLRIGSNKSLEMEIGSEPVRAAMGLLARSLNGEVFYVVEH